MASSSPIPDPEVPTKATRRRFTAAQKARILDAYEAASPIERAAICRRERIYSSLLSNWRKRRASGKPLSARRGAKPNPEAVEATRLQKRIAELERKSAKADRVIDVLWKSLRTLAGVCRRECGRAGSAAGERAVLDVSVVVGEREGCKQLGVSRASFQRHKKRRTQKAHKTAPKRARKG